VGEEDIAVMVSSLVYELEAIEGRRLRVEHRRLGHGGRGAAEKADRWREKEMWSRLSMSTSL
jgi:hypothetical protein